MLSDALTIGRFRTFLFGTACAFAVTAHAGAAHANPEGGVVSGGSADIAYNGGKLDVYQYSSRAVIDWRSFNIGAAEHTQFHQPGADSIVVNRINDINPSQINGRLSANGHVVLINPNGVMFGAGSRVDVGSLTATTADISNEDAMAGRLDFNRAGAADGKIVNAGHITAKEAGLVTLVAPQVENSGVIEAKLGKVTLASAETFSLDMAGDGLVKVAVSSAQLEQHVKNSGSISADGGSVVMSAGAARDIVDSLIVNTGHVRAKKGAVKMAAEGANKTTKQGNSKVVNQGTIDVSGTQAASDKGGSIVLTADEIELGATSILTADGNTGGGGINVGGDYMGHGIIPTSRRVRAEAGSRASADAIDSGDGGRVIYWSDDTTVFNGLISARGGAIGGNGGFVETSGKINLGVNGLADVSAARGEGGRWLLDPSNVRIIRPGGNAAIAGSNNPGSDDYTINADSIQTVLNGGSHVTVTTSNGGGGQAGTITVDATITWNTNRALTLQANSDIIVNQAITGQNIAFITNGDVDINANLTTNSAGFGSVSFSSISAGGTVGVGDGAAGTLHLSNEDLGYIQDGFGSGGVSIGHSTNTQTVNMAAYANWRDGFRISTAANGTINVNGTQNLNSNYMTFNTGTLNVLGNMTDLTTSSTGSHIFWTADTFNIQGTITGAGGFNTPTFTPRAAGRSLGAGDGVTCGGACDTVVTADMLNRFSGFASLHFNNPTGTAVEIGSGINWNSGLTVSGSTAGTVTVSAVQNMNNRVMNINGGTVTIDAAINGYGHGSYLTANTLNVNANVSGLGLNIGNRTLGSMGIGDGAAGDLQISNTTLGRIISTSLSFGGNASTTNLINVNAYTWAGAVGFYTTAAGTVNIDGAQNLNGYYMIVNAGTLNVNQAITGGGATSTLYVGQANINAPITTTAGLYFHLRTAGAHPVINAPITASGVGFLLGGPPKSLGVGDGSAGDILISNAALANIAGSLGFGGAPGVWEGNGWSAINVAAYDWNNRTIRFSGDAVTFNGNQTFGTGGLTIYTSSLPTFIGDISSSGAFSLYDLRSGSPYSLGLGDGAAGSVVMNNAYLDRLKTFGFSSYYLNARSGIDLRYGNWNKPLTLNTTNAGSAINVNGSINTNGNSLALQAPAINIIGDITRGAGTVSLYTDDLNFPGNINGTGVISIRPVGGSGSSLGLGDTSSGALKLTDAELDKLQATGTTELNFYAGAVDMRQRAWNAPFIRVSGVLTVNGIQNFNAGNITFDLFNSGTSVINHAVTGTGNFRVTGHNNSNLLIGSGATGGNLNLNDASLANIGDTFSLKEFSARHITLDRQTTWTFSPTFTSANGYTTTVTGAQNFGAYNATFLNNSMVLNGNLTGTGTLTFNTNGHNIVIGLGNGAGGGLNLDAGELNRIGGTFANVIFGSNTSYNNVIDIRAHTWNFSPTFLTTATGSIVVNGIQNFGAYNATFGTDTLHIAQNLNGTGSLTFGNATATTMRVGDGGAGALHIDEAELLRIQDGFGTLTFGNNLTTTLDLRAAASWRDNTAFVADTVSVSTQQNFGANNTRFMADNLNVSQDLLGTGTIAFDTRTAGRTIWFGRAVANSLNLTDDIITRLGDAVTQFAKVMIGDSAGETSDVQTHSVDLTGKTFNLDMYGNDVLIYNGFIMGSGSLLAHAMDSDNTLTPADAGTVSLDSMGMTRNAAGHAKADLRADSGIVLNGSITQANPGTLDILLNANRDGQADGGGISLSGGSLTSNGGTIALTGGNVDDGSNGGIAGDGIADGWAAGTANYGIDINGNIDSGAGRIQISGRGFDQAGAQSLLHGVRVLGGASIKTAAGSAGISLYGQAGNGLNDNYGVFFNNGHVEAFTGTVDIRGTGGGGAARNNGIFLVGASSVASKGTGGGGATIYMEGQQGGTAEGAGLYLANGSVVSSIDGDITLKGTGGSGSSNHDAEGVRISNGSVVRSTGTTADAAKINVIAQGGGSSVYSAHYGMVLHQAGIESVAGDIDITATGGTSGSNNFGLFMGTGSTPVAAHIESAGSASITIRATGGNATQYDAIRMDGSSYIGEGALAGSASGNINFITDGFNLPTTGTISTLGDITITPTTNNTNITLGADQAGRLSLNDAELALFNAGGKFVIGNAASGTGNITIDSWSLSGKGHNVEIYGNDISLTDTDGSAPANTALIMGNGNALLKSKAMISVGGTIAGNSAGSLRLEANNDVSFFGYGIQTTGTGDALVHAGVDGSGSIWLRNPLSVGGHLTLNAGGPNSIYLGNYANLTANGITALKNIVMYNNIDATRTLNAGAGALSLLAIDGVSYVAQPSDRNLVLIADDMILGGAITTPAGRTLDIRTHTAGRAINLGGGAGGLDLSDAELAYLQPGGLLTFGTAATSTGTLTVDTANFNSNVAFYGGQIALNGLSSTGTVFARSQGAGNDITLGGVVSSGAAGDSITLVSADDFYNNTGAGALFTSHVNGRWLVYSERMDENTRGGLMPDAVEFNASYPAAPAGTGNRLLYSSNVRPTLTLKVNDDAIFYDEDYLISRFGYSVTGGLVGGDTIGDIGLTGAPNYSTTYAFGITDPSGTPYDDMLNATAGTLASRMGYLIGTIQSGDLLVKGVRPVAGPKLPQNGLPATYQMVSADPTIMTASGAHGYGAASPGLLAPSAAAGRDESDKQKGNGTQGRVGLTFSEGYSFSTQGLNLFIAPEIRNDYDLPEKF